MSLKMVLVVEVLMCVFRAMQSKNSQGTPKSLCNVKHYQTYNVEKGKTNQGTGDDYNRGSFNAVVTKQDLAETYLSMFVSATQGANMGGTMCEYYSRLKTICSFGLQAPTML